MVNKKSTPSWVFIKYVNNDLLKYDHFLYPTTKG